MFALGGLAHLELYGVGLSGDVDRVGDHGDLAEEGQLVVGQEAVPFIQEEVSPEKGSSISECAAYKHHWMGNSRGSLGRFTFNIANGG